MKNRNRICWYKHPYMAPSVKGREKMIRYEMRFKKSLKGYYLITLPECDANLFDIWTSEEIRMPWVRARQFDIIGVAGSYLEAQELVGTIVYQVYQETGGFDVRHYLGYDQKM